MALSIKNSEIEKLARRQAKEAGVSVTQAILNALREKQANSEETSRKDIERKLKVIRAIQEEVKQIPGYEGMREDWIKNHKVISDALWE